MTDASPPDRYGVVGYPVRHSRSPLIHRLFAQQTRQHLTYELIEAEPARFEEVVRAFGQAGGRGLNVTVPHKEAAFRIASELGEAAEAARAVNTLSFGPQGLRGDNTDGVGFLRDLSVNLGCTVRGRRVLVLGAGGAARGILPPLLGEAPAELVMANRTLERAMLLKERFAPLGEIEACRFEDLEAAPPFDIVVNATLAGLEGRTPPFPAAIVGRGTLCYDLVYSRGDTPFVAWAREHGAGRAEQGWGMLVEQAAESFLIWRGIRPETVPVIAELARAR